MLWERKRGPLEENDYVMPSLIGRAVGIVTKTNGVWVQVEFELGEKRWYKRYQLARVELRQMR